MTRRYLFEMDFWSQEAVEEALGAEVAEAIPELLRLTDLEVRIPRMDVVAGFAEAVHRFRATMNPIHRCVHALSEAIHDAAGPVGARTRFLPSSRRRD